MRLAWFLFLLPAAGLAAETPPAKTPVVEEVEGAAALNVSFQKKTREAKKGDAIQYGESVETDSDTTGVVKYPDGSKILIQRSTRFVVEAKVAGDSGDEQWNKLIQGQVRGVIVKSPGEPPRRPKFLIRTKVATMGVRGTDFVMTLEAGASSAKVHTLEGLVEVAKDEQALLSGQGTSVAEGKFVEASQTGISNPAGFDKTQFLKSMGNGGTGASAGGGAGSGASGASGAAGAGAGAGSSLGGMLSHLSSAASAPRLPRDTPPPAPKLAPHQEKNQQQGEPGAAPKPPEEEDKRTKFASVELGAFYVPNQIDANTYKSLSAFYTPTIGVPTLTMLSIRGSFGAHFAMYGSLDNQFFVPEFQVFANIAFAKLIYIEAGGGEQIWWHGGPDATVGTVKAGIMVNKGGVIHRAFIGYSKHFIPGQTVGQLRAGIGLVFF